MAGPMVAAAEVPRDGANSGASPSYRRARNRMQLAYTLLNNPSVVKHRRDHAALKECSSEKRDPSKVHPV